MPLRVHLTLADRGRAIGMLLAGQLQTQVAHSFHVSQSVISRLWNSYLGTGNAGRKPGSGRPKKTTAIEDRRIVTLAKRRRFESASTLNRQFERASGVRISTQTFRNRLHVGKLNARRPVVRPPLTAEHRRRRLEFAREHVGWGRQRLRRILFTDESKFCLDFHDGRRRVWRQKNERYRDCCVAEHDRFGGGSVLAWAGISYDGSTDLHVIENGSLTGLRYRDEILEPIVRPFAGAVGGRFLLMDDNARPHRARVVTSYLEDEGIARMDWPARSPDINPIEHAWDMLQRRISARFPKPDTRQELANALKEEWKNIPHGEIQTLVLSFNNRCREVIRARGGHNYY